MIKPFLLFQGPLRSRSGYGDHTRDLLLSLVKMGKYDIKIAATRWGDCPETGLDLSIPDHQILNTLVLNTNQLPKQPDIYINCSVPNEWQPVGKYNIGITAGIETTACDPTWIEGCNRMDLIIVPSNHSRDVIKASVFDKMDKNSNTKVGELKLEKPIEVLFEGLDTLIYKKLETPVKSIDAQLKNISEDFCFLYVGHWLQGKMGHDRKDTGMLVSTFCNTFAKVKKKPALILKTSSATFSIMDRNMILDKVKGIRKQVGEGCPNVYVVHGDLTAKEMNGLYNHEKVKAHVSFTKGEGFGRPLLEATVSEKPVIASAWSGQLDFLHPKYSTLLPGTLKEVHKSARWKGVINGGTQWFYVDYQIAEKVLRDVYQSYNTYLPGSKKQAEHSLLNFTMEKMSEGFSEIINKYIKIEVAPQQVKMNLPNLKKLKAPKLDLPKLKKV